MNFNIKNIESENKNKDNNFNKIYKNLQSNTLISYKIKTNNKIYKNFSLTEKETEIFSIILNILKKNNLNTTICRVAGGWIRDKLLGKESDDIDIVVNDIEGSKLIFIINAELYTKGHYKLGIIPKNEKKGKNIEVATTNICNTSIDFVRLRTNKKDEIPTPLSDAELRDLSINSLFYNINEQKVEDCTGRGIKDLENGIINTPVEPEVAILNDSFIILRMLRFAIKYKFRISDNINNYLENNKDIILNNFYKKVSRERIGKELFKIFQLENSEFIIAYLYSFNLLDIILLLKDGDDNNNYEELFLKITNLYILGEYLLKIDKIFEIEINSNNFNKINYSLLLLTLYFRDIKDKNNLSINQKILRRTYKTSNEHKLENKNMCKYFDELLNFINKEQYDRFKVGKFLRKISCKNIIPILYASIAYEYIEQVKLKSLLFNLEENILQKIIDKIKKFFNFIITEDLLHIDKLIPLLNGKEILETMDIKTDKIIKSLVDYLIDEQIKDPKLNKNQAIELLNKKIEEFHLSNKNKIKDKTNKNEIKK